MNSSENESLTLKQAQHLFPDIDDQTLVDVLRLKRAVAIKKGEFLFKAGSRVSGLHCILSGKLKLSKTSLDGRENVVSVLGANDILAELESQMNLSAFALTDVKALQIVSHDLSELVEKSPKFLLSLYKRSEQSRVKTLDKLSQNLSKSVRSKVMYLLSDFAENHSLETSYGLRLELPLTREEMSSMIGVATETFIRVLAELKNEKIIGVSENYYLFTSRFTEGIMPWKILKEFC
ncbi:MAG: Crp/Fnr family transcriptional regulator [Bacteriovoracaceae bacterium]|nr:Crp/Fnr family transcriptional regulator [Bacteriovoracaceae bacterium]